MRLDQISATPSLFFNQRGVKFTVSVHLSQYFLFHHSTDLPAWNSPLSSVESPVMTLTEKLRSVSPAALAGIIEFGVMGLCVLLQVRIWGLGSAAAQTIRCQFWCLCAELCAPAGVCWARGMPGIELAPSMLVFVSVALSESISHLQNLQIGNYDLVISAKSVAQVTATAAQHLRWGKRKASALHLPVFRWDWKHSVILDMGREKKIIPYTRPAKPACSSSQNEKKKNTKNTLFYFLFIYTFNYCGIFLSKEF